MKDVSFSEIKRLLKESDNAKTIKEGSRNHVVHYDSYGRHCSELDCEINSETRKP